MSLWSELRRRIVATVLGFPVAALLAWRYEWTPEGIRPATDLPDFMVLREQLRGS